MDKNTKHKIANNVRMKLLLFIDREIHSHKKNNSKFIQKENLECTSLIYLEETFCQNISIYFYFTGINKIFYENMKKRTEIHKNTTSAIGAIPVFITSQSKKLKKQFSYFRHETTKEEEKNIFLNTISKYKKIDSALNPNFDLKEKVYSMKTKKNTSNYLDLNKKLKRDKKYLLKLCNSLKIMKSKDKIPESNKFLIKNIPKSKYTSNAATTHFLITLKKNKRRASEYKNIYETEEVKTKTKKKSLSRKIKKNNSNINNIIIFEKSK